MSRSALCAAFVAAFLAHPVSAAELRLEIADGFVTLVATDAPLRAILAEWTKVGATRIVNAERVAGPPVTLQLQRVPEQQALAILLRSVAGYLAAPRRAGTAGASQYESVMILATSTPPAGPAAAPAAAARGPINPAGRPILNPAMLGQDQPPQGGDGEQIPSDGFIAVGNAPPPRQPTPATGTGSTPAATMGSQYPQVPVAGTKVNQPPGSIGPPRPTTVQPGMIPNADIGIQTTPEP
jgi:hypothetical protein